MRLNPNQVTAVENYLQGIPETRCALCHSQEWKVSELIFALPEYVQRSPAAFGIQFQFDTTDPPKNYQGIGFSKKEPEVFPVIPIVCGRCGFVFLLSAIAAGAIKGGTF